MELLRMVTENYEFIIDNKQKQGMLKEVKYYYKKIIKVDRDGKYLYIFIF